MHGKGLKILFIPQKIPESKQLKNRRKSSFFSDISAQSDHVGRANEIKPFQCTEANIWIHFETVKNALEFIPFTGRVPKRTPFPRKPLFLVIMIHYIETYFAILFFKS